VRFLFVPTIGAAVLLSAPRAQACAPAPRQGDVVRIADEEALIVWDEQKKVEHFVRRASFVSSGEAFGFLVPSPAKPELGEVAAAVFDDLSSRLTPPIVYEDGGLEIEPGCTAMWMLRASSESGAASATAPVRVLDTQRVAGFDAVVLAADDPAALSAWLKERDFAEGPTLTDWLTPYVKNKWVVTAFKIADSSKADGKPGARSIGTSSVRMSFATDRPFYPYREPADQRETLPASHKHIDPSSRVLRVYFVSSTKVDGMFENGDLFPRKVKLATALAHGSVSAELPMPAMPFLTVFEDTSSPRPGVADVFFSPAKDPSPVLVPPIVIRRPTKIPLPLDLLAVFVGVVAAVTLAIRRRRR
jgi:hypothetical protein